MNQNRMDAIEAKGVYLAIWPHFVEEGCFLMRNILVNKLLRSNDIETGLRPIRDDRHLCFGMEQ
jgi:hypothetical protein